MRWNRLGVVVTLFAACAVDSPADAEDKPKMSEAELVKAVQNPVANLISLPFQNNTDFGVWPEDETRNTLNIQPVVPFKVGQDWLMITRTIMPVMAQPNTFANLGGVVLSNASMQAYYNAIKADSVPADDWQLRLHI